MPDNSNGPTKVQSEAVTQNQTSQEGVSGNDPCCGGSREDGFWPLPLSLAGYQHIEAGPIKLGDIWYSRYGHGPVCGSQVGLNVEDVLKSIKDKAWAVYRKMPCAQQGDCDQTGWREKQRELMARVDEATVKATKAQIDATNVHLSDPEWYLKQALAASMFGDKAKTDDDGKPPLAHLPWAGIDEVAMVQAYGHKKYKDFNNYRKGLEVGRNLSCAIRHIRAYMEGEDLDPESHRNHLAHAACRLLFVLQNIHDKTQIDDRFKKRNQ